MGIEDAVHASAEKTLHKEVENSDNWFIRTTIKGEVEWNPKIIKAFIDQVGETYKTIAYKAWCGGVNASALGESFDSWWAKNERD